MNFLKVTCLMLCLGLAACSGDSCDSNQATNKMLVLGKVQGRLVARGGQEGMVLAATLGKESGSVSELMAQQKFGEACKKADEIAKKWEIRGEECERTNTSANMSDRVFCLYWRGLGVLLFSISFCSWNVSVYV